MHQILCSTGALIGRPNGRDYRLLKQFCPQLECDGFELILYDSWYEQIEDLKAFLRELKLNIPVMHCEKSMAEHISRGGEEELREAFRLFEANCTLANAIGAEKMVLHLWNGVVSDSHFENNLKAWPELNRRAGEHGLTLFIVAEIKLYAGHAGKARAELFIHVIPVLTIVFQKILKLLLVLDHHAAYAQFGERRAQLVCISRSGNDRFNPAHIASSFPLYFPKDKHCIFPGDVLNFIST